MHNDSIHPEEWRDVRNYEGLYQISSHGRVRSIGRVVMRRNGCPMRIRDRILKPGLTNYYQTALAKNGVVKTKSIHVLIAEAFIPNPNNKPEVNHIDGNKLNNQISNLEWATKSEQALHAVGLGVWPDNSGERNGMSKTKRQNRKLLCAGQRGAKSERVDLEEAQAALSRSIELAMAEE